MAGRGLGAARILAAATATVGWAGLALQLWLIVDNLGIALGAWRFVGFFTILTNIGAATVATAIALGCRNALAGPGARLMAASAILLVGIVYSLALRSTWNPQGLQKLADMALHDATPLLFAATWLAGAHGQLDWRDIGWALLPPALYAGYALVRGLADGWYAYWFLDPSRQDLSELALSMTLILAAVGAIAALLTVADRRLGRKPSA